MAEVPVAAVFLVLALGAGLGALGLLVPDFYFVGLIVLMIGGIGLLVRGLDAWRWLRG